MQLASRALEAPYNGQMVNDDSLQNREPLTSIPPNGTDNQVGRCLWARSAHSIQPTGFRNQQRDGCSRPTKVYHIVHDPCPPAGALAGAPPPATYAMVDVVSVDAPPTEDARDAAMPTGPTGASKDGMPPSKRIGHAAEADPRLPSSLAAPGVDCAIIAREAPGVAGAIIA